MSGWSPVVPDRISGDKAYTNEKKYCGCYVKTTGAAAQVLVRDGPLVSSPIAFDLTVEAVAGGTTRPFLLPAPVRMPADNGFFVDIVAGVSEITVLFAVG